MKNILLSLLVAVLILGALGVAGYVGYQYGFNQGVLAASDGGSQFFGPGFGLRQMPMHDFGFSRGFGRDGFGMMQRDYGFGFGFFPPFAFLLRLLFWGLIIGAVYMLVTRSGWRLTRTTTAEPSSPASNGEHREP